MEDKKLVDIAKECGQRLRRVRMSKNMSQQNVAELMGTTPQNISKWEKNGVPGINDIKRLSEILGQDLLSEERDVEGIVGEIGREILRMLIGNGGDMEFEDVIKGLYGLDESIATEEIFKIGKIGMCVREQYTDFYDKERDTVFITAKGVICIKNSRPGRNPDFEMMEKLAGVRTYEMLLSNYYDWDEENDKQPPSCFQDIIDDRLVEKKIRSLPLDCYKEEFILWMKNNYCSNIDRKYSFSIGKIDDIYEPVNFYHDVMIRIIAKLTEERRRNWEFNAIEFDGIEVEVEQMTDQHIFGTKDTVEIDFCKRLRTLSNYYNVSMEGYEDYIPESEAVKKKEEELENIESEICIDFDKYVFDLCEEKGINPLEWFSEDEIRTFILDNYCCKKGDWEEIIDSGIAEIAALCPEVYEYFRFPASWEENGLADMVRDIYNVTKRNTELEIW